jgi:hypothetical protein
MKKWLWITFAIGAAAQVFYFSRNPQFVASHFGHAGMADGWMSGQTNLFLSIITLAVNTLIFASMERVFQHIPVRYISFPNKAYWLSPERKSTSIRLMSRWLAFFGLATNLFLMVVFHMVYRANQVMPPRLDEQLFIGLLCLYFVILGVWLILLYRRFKTPPVAG